MRKATGPEELEYSACGVPRLLGKMTLWLIASVIYPLAIDSPLALAAPSNPTSIGGLYD